MHPLDMSPREHAKVAPTGVANRTVSPSPITASKVDRAEIVFALNFQIVLQSNGQMQKLDTVHEHEETDDFSPPF